MADMENHTPASPNVSPAGAAKAAPSSSVKPPSRARPESPTFLSSTRPVRAARPQSPGLRPPARAGSPMRRRAETPTRAAKTPEVVSRLTMTKAGWDAHLAKLADEKLKLELKECTFSPKLSRSGGAKKLPGAARADVFDSLSHTQIRDFEALERKRGELELKACTFQPQASRRSGEHRGSGVHERLYEDAGARKSRLSNDSTESLRDGETPALAKMRRQEEAARARKAKP
jgi:hypothetical protein